MLPNNTFTGFILFDANITSEQLVWLEMVSIERIQDDEDHVMYLMSGFHLLQAAKEFNKEVDYVTKSS